jgi:hypothetical protein
MNPEDDFPMVVKGAGGTIPIPCHPQGDYANDPRVPFMPVEVTVQGWTHPEEAVLALMLFTKELMESHQRGDTARADEMCQGLPEGTRVVVNDPDAEGPRLCEEHAEEVAAKFGGQIAEDAEKFLRELNGN